MEVREDLFGSSGELICYTIQYNLELIPDLLNTNDAWIERPIYSILCAPVMIYQPCVILEADGYLADSMLGLFHCKK